MQICNSWPGRALRPSRARVAAEQLFSYDLTELGIFHRAYERLMAHWRRRPERFIEVRYEDVVDDFPAPARRMVEWLGLLRDDARHGFNGTGRVRTPRACRRYACRSTPAPWADGADIVTSSARCLRNSARINFKAALQC
jgi:hypothetical protein